MATKVNSPETGRFYAQKPVPDTGSEAWSRCTVSRLY